MDLINYKMLNGHVKAPTSIRCHPCKEYNTFEVVDLGVKLLDFCPVAHRLSREEKIQICALILFHGGKRTGAHRERVGEQQQRCQSFGDGFPRHQLARALARNTRARP